MKKTAKTVAIAAAFAALSLSGCKGPIDSANENLVYGPPSDYKVEESSSKEDSSSYDDTITDSADSADSSGDFIVDQHIQVEYGPPDDSDYSDYSDYSEDDNHYNPEDDTPTEVYGPPNFE